MLRWIIGTAVVTVIIAIVITWQAYSCETQNKEPQSAAAAQPLTNPMLIIPGSPNGNTNQELAQDQESGSETHANSYFCRVATPTNLPTIYLVLIGFGGIAVAIGTLKILEAQTRATEIAAEATQASAKATADSVKLQRVAMTQWVKIENWGIKARKTNTLTYEIYVNLLNETGLPLTIEHASFGGSNGITTINPPKDLFLVPKAHHPVNALVELTEEEATQRDESTLVLNITIVILYRDAFRKSDCHIFGQGYALSGVNYELIPYKGTLPSVLGQDGEEENENPN